MGRFLYGLASFCLLSTMAKKLIVFPEILFEDFDQFFKGLVKSNHWMKLDEILGKDQYLYSLSNGGVSFCQFLLFPSFFYDFNNLSMPIANRAKSADFARQNH